MRYVIANFKELEYDKHYSIEVYNVYMLLGDGCFATVHSENNKCTFNANVELA